MYLCQELYSAGLISYPRTESSRYHASFDAGACLRPLAREFRAAATALKTWRGAKQGARARDVGDHPPIVPLRAPEAGEVTGQRKRVYDYVCQHFVARLDVHLGPGE